MKPKLTLATATALGLLMGAAHAQSAFEDEAYINQDGNTNTLLVDQDQTYTGQNQAGILTQPITQDGNFNQIDIRQNQTAGPTNNVIFDNKVGTGGEGIDQVGNRNLLDVSQTGYGHQVHEVQQNGGGGSTGVSNEVHVTQNGGRSTVAAVTQTFHGNTSDAANSVVIHQSGGMNLVGNTSTGPSPQRVRQTGHGNTLIVDQSGRGHLYESVQWNAGPGGTNRANVTQTGNGAFIHRLSQTNTGATDNEIVTTQDGDNTITEIEQIGGGNMARAQQTGVNNTLTLFEQLGTGNTGMVVQSNADNNVRISVLGDGNITDSNQSGVGGDASIDVLNSDDNNAAIIQSANGIAAVLITDRSDRNGVRVNQSGGDTADVIIQTNADDNNIGVSQNGTNTANITVTGGDGNALNAQQWGASSMTVNVYGNNNNNWATTGNSLTGDALEARNFARNDAANSNLSGVATFGQGDLFQDGAGNSLTLNINGNGGALATYQRGNGNTIDGTVSGSMNQAVVVQINTGATGASATFTQVGNGNVLGVMQ